MARIRTIKPDFFTSEEVVDMPFHVRLLYIALWCEADREGRLVWKPRTMKMRYFPGDNFDINEACQHLVSSGHVILYGDGLAYIPTFLDHQHINPRESKSDLPSPFEGARVDEALSTRDARGVIAPTAHRDAPVTCREEGKGKEGKHNASDDACDPSRRTRSAFPVGFAEFWDAYPKKRSKGAAEKAWRRLKPSADLQKIILEALEAATVSDDWRRDDGQFIPYPASWLNAKGWDDELATAHTVCSRANSLFAGAL